jgi:hypothetical protein
MEDSTGAKEKKMGDREGRKDLTQRAQKKNTEFAEKRNPRDTARNGCATRLPIVGRQDAEVEILRTILVGSPQDDTLFSSLVKLWS